MVRVISDSPHSCLKHVCQIHSYPDASVSLFSFLPCNFQEQRTRRSVTGCLRWRFKSWHTLVLTCFSTRISKTSVYDRDGRIPQHDWIMSRNILITNMTKICDSCIRFWKVFWLGLKYTSDLMLLTEHWRLSHLLFLDLGDYKHEIQHHRSPCDDLNVLL